MNIQTFMLYLWDTLRVRKQGALRGGAEGVGASLLDSSFSNMYNHFR